MGFLDQRQWMASLEQHGELRRIKTEVDSDRELAR
jgi:3-polyprenyl-4-hydroxybenzoate decarboxylase